jgi:hypothetical protein
MSVVFASTTARDFAERVGSAIVDLSEQWSDVTLGDHKERVHGFLNALQSIHMTSFSRQSYLAICDECAGLDLYLFDSFYIL